MNKLKVSKTVRFLVITIIMMLVTVSTVNLVKINTELQANPMQTLVSSSNSGNVINMGGVKSSFCLGSSQSNFSKELTGHWDGSMAFDSNNGFLYEASGNLISQMNLSQNKVTNIIKSENFGTGINWLGFDNINDKLYLVVYDISGRPDNVNTTIISLNPSTGRINVLLPNMSSCIYATAIDTQNNSLFFASNGNVTSLNLSTNSINNVANLGQVVYSLLYSKSENILYANEGTRIAIINLNENDSIKYVKVNGCSIFGMVHDAINNVFITGGEDSNTILIINGTTGKINKTINCTIQINSVAYNPVLSYVYLLNRNGSVSVLNATSLTVSGHLKVSSFNGDAICNTEYSAFDNKRNEVYIGYTAKNQIIPFKGNEIESNSAIPLGDSTPIGAFYDKYNNVLYVSASNGTLSAFNATTLTSQGEICTGLRSTSFALDPSSGYLYVSNSFSNTVSIVNTKTFFVVKNVTVGSDPGSIFYCSKTNDVYTLNRNSNNITVFTASGSVITSIPFFKGYYAGGATSMIYDKSTGYIYVFVKGSKAIDAINIVKMQYVGYFIGLNGPLMIGDTVLDPITGKIIECPGTAWTPSTNNTTPLSSLPSSFGSAVYDSSNQNIFAIDSGSGKGFSLCQDIGVINATTEYLEGNITVGSWIRSIAVDTSNNNIFALPLHSAKILVVKLFPEYNVNFRETGMISPVSWFINMNGRPANFTIGSSSESIYLPNGTYSYTIGTTQLYSASPHSGTVHVDGSGITVTVTFSFEYSQYLEQNYIYFLTIAGIAIAGIYFIWRRRR